MYIHQTRGLHPSAIRCTSLDAQHHVVAILNAAWGGPYNHFHSAAITLRRCLLVFLPFLLLFCILSVSLSFLPLLSPHIALPPPSLYILFVILPCEDNA